MFKPQRLIYRETTRGDPKHTFDSRFLQGTQDVVTEGVPAAFEAVARHPGEVVKVAADAVDLTVEGVRKGFEGVMKGMWTGGVETLGKNVLWEDLGAAPRSLIVEGTKSVVSATYGTVKNIFKGEGKAAAKSFFWHGIGGVLATPFKAAWNGLKGAINLVPDVVVGGAKTVGHVAGLKMDAEGELAPAKHGLVPAVGSILKGASKLLTAPFGRLKKWLMEKKDARFDTSVKWRGGDSSPKTEKAHGGSMANHTSPVPVAPAARTSSAFGKQGVGHIPGKNTPAENGHSKPAKAANPDDALAAAMAQASVPGATPAAAQAGHGYRHAHAYAPKSTASSSPASPDSTAVAAPDAPATTPTAHH